MRSGGEEVVDEANEATARRNRDHCPRLRRLTGRWHRADWRRRTGSLLPLLGLGGECCFSHTSPFLFLINPKFCLLLYVYTTTHTQLLIYNKKKRYFFIYLSREEKVHKH